MSELRALLLTDVVDSTRLSERIGDQAMAAVWAAHDRAARDLLPVWRGREIDKTDGMLLLFDAVADAVGYSLAYHRALADLPVPLHARAGVHYGPVLLRENSAADVERGAKPLEVDGLAKPAAARIMALARGGQTLLSEPARAALSDAPWPMCSHGHWVLKGINDPMELFEVGASGLDFCAPDDGEKAYRVIRLDGRWLPTREIPNNLPVPLTSFLGRQRELREVKTLLEEARLLTLVGMGGMGKTRLSLQVAAELRMRFPDGAWFLDLAPIRDPELVVSEAAKVLGVREEPGRSLQQTLCAFVRSHRALLIFDNCEHLVGAAAALADTLLRAAPNLSVIASSREALRVPGEQVYAVLPLPLPRSGDGVDALWSSAAARLFVERVQSHKPGFVLDEREAPAVAELVIRLEGIPLALELAAARARSLSLVDINRRLGDRYKLLTGGGRVLLERQQTLRALVDWSYDLLHEDEQRLFARLSVFVAGFGLEAAEAVCGADPQEPDDVLDLLASLVDKSLVSADHRDDGTRYRMLETIRDYAREKLARAFDAADTAARHCGHYFAFAKAARDGLMAPDTADWVRRAEADLDNIRAAIALALSGGADPILAVKFAVTMTPFWLLRGHASEGRNIVRAALALPEIQASDLAVAHASYAGAALADGQADHAEARRMLEACLELHRKLGNEVDVAATLSMLSLARLKAGDAHGAETSEREALAMFRGLNLAEGEAIGELHLGQIAVFVADADAAQAHLEGCLRIAQAIGHHEVEGEAELRLAENAFNRNCRDDARLHLKRSLDICAAAGDRRGEARATYWLGRVDLADGDLSNARDRLGEAARTFVDFEMREELVDCLEDHAELAARLGHADLAVRLAGATHACRARLDLARSSQATERWSRWLDSTRQRFSPDAFERAWAAGLATEYSVALRVALQQDSADPAGA